jgi:hypothetical protein
MNLRQTAEVAALAARMAEAVIHNPQPVPTEALHAYWKSSRMRLKYWFAGMRAVPVVAPGAGACPALHVHKRVNLARGILVSEMLTRVWSSVLVARDVARCECVTGPLVRQVFLGQVESRREVLIMLADERLLPVDQATNLGRLRERIERWTDLLIGPLVNRYAVTEFAFDIERARECASIIAPVRRGDQGQLIEQLTRIGLSQAIAVRGEDDGVSAALNLAVARSVLIALPLAGAES